MKKQQSKNTKLTEVADFLVKNIHDNYLRYGDLARADQCINSLKDILDLIKNKDLQKILN